MRTADLDRRQTGADDRETTDVTSRLDPPCAVAATPGGQETARGDFTALAERAMARLRAETCADGISADTRDALGAPMVTALAHALCDDEDETADLMVDDMIAAGLSVEEVCLDHLAPAARRLGEWWDKDRLPFTDVTLASARIQTMMRRMSQAAPRNRHAPHDRGAIFVAVPGEQHTLGVMMAADLFRRKGWDVGLLVGLSYDDLMARLVRDDRAVIGLSCSGDHSCAALARLMEALRRRRPEARLILSGQIVRDAGRLAALPAPDALVATAAEAEAEILKLEAMLAGRSGTARAVARG